MPVDLHPDVEVGLCAQVACIWEVSARKVGNVTLGSAFAGTSAVDFLLSAAAIAVRIDRCPGSTVGSSVVGSVLATGALVGQNTNLGIVLLLVPLATVKWPFPLLLGVRTVLSELTVEDTRLVYEAIRIAAPGGLGDAPEQDVRDEPTVTLLEAMRLAADRDLIARQYANNYADVFDLGVPALLDAFARFGCVEAAVIDCQLRWLAAFPDSLIARKCGPAVAADVQRRVQHVLELGGLETPEGRAAGVALDQYLRSDGNKLNPGTTADLVTACLFVALREGKIQPSAPFRWTVPDWL